MRVRPALARITPVDDLPVRVCHRAIEIDENPNKGLNKNGKYAPIEEARPSERTPP